MGITADYDCVRRRLFRTGSTVRLLKVALIVLNLTLYDANAMSAIAGSPSFGAPDANGRSEGPAAAIHRSLAGVTESHTLEASTESPHSSEPSSESAIVEEHERKPVDVLSLFVIALLIGVFTHHVLKFTKLPYTALLMVRFLTSNSHFLSSKELIWLKFGSLMFI